jgi:uncharacterized YigZ family protein
MSYVTLKGPAEAELTEKKSRFVAAAAPVGDEREALDFIESRRRLHRTAAHTVYAYFLRQGNIRRCSDGGEPQGTGGIPVMELMAKEGLTDVCLVVSRYFGGTLLGTGGLTRAFTGAASLALAAAQRRTMVCCRAYELSLGYAQYQRIQRLIAGLGGHILRADYGETVRVELLLPADKGEDFEKKLAEETAATASLRFVEKRYEDAAFFTC